MTSEQLAQVIATAMKASHTTLLERIAVLEARAAVPGPMGPAGRDGLDGKDGAAGPVGERGDKGADGLSGKDGLDGKDGAAGLNGKDVDPVFVKATIEEAIAARPLPKDGRDGKDAVLPDIDEIALRAAQLVPTPKDGRDGQPGVPGRDGERGEKGLDGAVGRDGVDGRDGTLEGVVVKQIDDRHAQFCRADGSVLGTVKMASLRDRGVFKDGVSYEAGDGVTFGGSFFIAQDDTTSKPETDHTWRLAVKRGRDGKDGRQGPAGAPGAKGEAGISRDYR